MIAFNVRFGRRGRKEVQELENVLETYLGALLRQGHLCRDYFFGWQNGVLNAHVLASGSTARQLRYHSDYAKKVLAKVKEAFGREPVWIPLDDEVRKRPISWKRAPFLYLFTHALDWDSSVCRGDNGFPVPVYLLPLPTREKESLTSWQGNYYHLDNLWLSSGALEIPAYRQLADPGSDLAEDGRELCRVIEKTTGTPTYYYLMRYWARTKNEEERRCPGCGGAWRTAYPTDASGRFCEFPFQCRKCRLVSHAGVSFDDGKRKRYSEIGEYRKKKPRKRN